MRVSIGTKACSLGSHIPGQMAEREARFTARVLLQTVLANRLMAYICRDRRAKTSPHIAQLSLVSSAEERLRDSAAVNLDSDTLHAECWMR